MVSSVKRQNQTGPLRLLNLFMLMLGNDYVFSGSKLSGVYDAATSFVKSKRPELFDKMTKNVGFAMGIEFREGALLITGKASIVVKKSKIFFLSLMFE